MKPRALTSIILAAGLLAACQQQPPQQPGVKLGKPYVVSGKSYYPQYEADYDRTGVASWYGPGFHGKRTASGEEFDQDDLTAAHPTLPMPSLVRVTNLENGKSLVVRVNDRGPFKKNRLIDLSKASATRLGITSLARVRIQYLKAESEQYLADNGVSMEKFNAEMKKYAANTPPPPSPRIVESTVAVSKGGQPINDAAPVVSVSSDEIHESSPPRKIGLIREAVADDTVTASDVPPPATSEPASEPETSGVRINANETITEVDPKPIPLRTPEEIRSSAPSSGGSYIIRAGAFGVEQNAWMLVSKVSKYAEAKVDQMEVDGKTLWRVHIGPFASREEAEATAEKVRKLGAPDARVARQ